MVGVYDYIFGCGLGSNYGNWYLSSSKNILELRFDFEFILEGYDNNLCLEVSFYIVNIVVVNIMFVICFYECLG